MNTILKTLAVTFLFLLSTQIHAQQRTDSGLLSIDRIFNSSEFRQDRAQQIQWIENGAAYVTIESTKNGNALMRYDCKSQKSELFIDAGQLKSINIESFSLSPDGTKVLIFTNSKRVWRSNTKGDFYVYDLTTKKLQQLGKKFSPSSLMFAKFSADNKYVAYVHEFNLYKEEFSTGKISQLTSDGSKDIINGTFDWVYEEEFGCRDGFRWSPNGQHIAYWQLDASDIRTFYMINNTDSIYSQLIPLQYPKVGEDPSACKIGIVDQKTAKTKWIELEGGDKANYIPAIQWLSDDLLLIQQMNRKQNELKIWTYQVSSGKLKKIYTEVEDTWVDLNYPDASANNWGQNDLALINNNQTFLRLTENDAWRHVYKVNIADGSKQLLTPGEYDVASVYCVTDKDLYFVASPDNSTQRYLYRIPLNGKAKAKRITPNSFSGINKYNIAPNGMYAVHSHSSTAAVPTTRFVQLPAHKTIVELVDNADYQKKIDQLKMPEISFFKVTTKGGIDIDGRMIKPLNFDENKKYPVIFHVYGEPWGQVAKDEWINLWDIMLAQKGFIVIAMDNRGTPCLKGSQWRKSIYRKVGVINSRDQAMAATEVLKWKFIDKEKTAVWGWSGGGSMTLNLMFRYPEIYKTGVSVAPVANQLAYDNIYQERYMGLPQENMEEFIEGSPVTYAKNLEGNLLLIHGTADDNVHYQNAELIVNELIKHNKQFDFMSYPNRAHGIYEGANTRRHLYTLITNYLIEKNR